MAIQSDKATAEAHIRKLVDDRVKATRAKDVDGCLSSSAPDVLLFDVVNPLEYEGVDEGRQRLEEWFSQFANGPLATRCGICASRRATMSLSASTSTMSAPRR